MSDQKLFAIMLKNDLPAFKSVFLSLPDPIKDWRAHPKNKSTQELAADMVTETGSFPLFLKNESVDIYKIAPHGVTSPKEMAEIFDATMKAGLEIVESMSEEEWDSPTALTFGDKPFMQMTKGMMSWSLLVDLIHHRGQLTTHIRPQGGQVPAIYGPSGDTK